MSLPTSFREVVVRFADPAACNLYLEALRWPEGFVCPGCDHRGGWRSRDGRWSCGGCAARVSVTAGTTLHATRVGLPVWVQVAWQLAEFEHGVNARTVHDRFELGSYQTAWTLLHRYRQAMAAAHHTALDGHVVVDTVPAAGMTAADQAPDRPRAVVAIAAQAPTIRAPAGPIRLAVLPERTSASLEGFVADHVTADSAVLVGGRTDGLADEQLDGPYLPAVAGRDPTTAVVAGLGERLRHWVRRTHHTTHPEHLPAYLHEFSFRHNHRQPDQPGVAFLRLLELALAGDPTSYRQLTGGS